MSNPNQSFIASKKPDFLCIGAQKAGTTWLFNILKKHPQIWMPPVKEIHYFDQIYLGKNFNDKIILKQLANGLQHKINGKNVNLENLYFWSKYTLNPSKDDRWYLSLFDRVPIKSVVGEITPSYSALPEAGVEHIKSLLGNVKIVYILRNPLKRAWSSVVMSQREAIISNKQISDEQWLRLLKNKKFKIRGDYQKTIELYEKYFDTSQILYLFFDDISLNPSALIKQVCDFLEIDYQASLFQNTTKSYNKNPSIKIPTVVEEYLRKEYNDQERWIRSRFNRENFNL